MILWPDAHFWKLPAMSVCKRIAEIAATGVDLISVGELTHSVRAADISLEDYQGL